MTTKGSSDSQQSEHGLKAHDQGFLSEPLEPKAPQNTVPSASTKKGKPGRKKRNDWQSQYLEARKRLPTITAALKEADASTTMLWRERRENPRFSKEEQLASEEFADLVEEVVWEHALSNPTVAMQMLKAQKPQIYNVPNRAQIESRVTHEHAHTLSLAAEIAERLSIPAAAQEIDAEAEIVED